MVAFLVHRNYARRFITEITFIEQLYFCTANTLQNIITVVLLILLIHKTIQHLHHYHRRHTKTLYVKTRLCLLPVWTLPLSSYITVF